MINHGNGYVTLYGHLSAVLVTVGEPVQRGQVIGLEGSTGFSTGPHLHFEIRKDGVFQNPLAYLN
jgi:murein DD-endopeptidase MepM/ murein hydrolase activator NlpD